MTNHNEYGAELFLSAMERYQSGTSNIRTALRDAAKGYGEMYRRIVASNGGVEPKTSAMAGKLKDILTSRGPLADNVCKWIDNRNHRAALLWMDQNADKVAWVFFNSEASTPETIYKAWQNYFRKTIKAGWDESEKGDAVEPKDFLGVDFPGVTLDEVEAEWTRLAELKAKREEEREKEQEQPEPEPTADITTIIASMDVMALAEAVARRPDAKAIADGLYQLFARLEAKPRARPQPQVDEVPNHQMKEADWIWDLSDAEITEKIQSSPHRSVDFAVFRRDDTKVPVLTGRWAKKSRQLWVITFDGRKEDVPHEIKTKASSRQIKIALGRFLGPGPGAFYGTDEYSYAFTLENLNP